MPNNLSVQSENYLGVFLYLIVFVQLTQTNHRAINHNLLYYSYLDCCSNFIYFWCQL